MILFKDNFVSYQTISKYFLGNRINVYKQYVQIILKFYNSLLFWLERIIVIKYHGMIIWFPDNWNFQLECELQLLKITRLTRIIGIKRM